MGFSKSLQWATNNQMELLALREGLQIIKDHQLTPVVINIDFNEVVSMLQSGNLHYNTIIDECSLRLGRIENPQVVHCFREQNNVVDVMARKGAADAVDLTTNVFEVP